MEALFYKFISEKRIKRVIKMLEYLYEAKHRVTVQELAGYLGVTIKTLHNTIALCNMHLETGGTVTLDNRYVVYNGGLNQSVEDALMSVAKKSVEFQILECAFTHQGKTTQELATQLYVSESLIRSRIRHMNQVLAPFGCELSRYVVQMMGNETDIRYFYYVYYNEIQELFLNIKGDMLRYVSEVMRHIDVEYTNREGPMLHYSLQQLVRWLLLVRERILAGCTVQLDETLMQSIRPRETYQYFKRIYERHIFDSVGGIPICESEIIWAYVVAYSTTVYTKDVLLNPCYTLYAHDGDAHKQASLIQDELKEIVDTLDLQSAQHNAFIEILSAYFVNLSLLTKLSPLFQRGSSSVLNYAQQSFPSLFKIWESYLTFSTLGQVVPMYHLEYVAAQCALLSSQFITDQKQFSNCVLFSFEGEAGVCAHLETIANNLLPDDIKRVFVYNDVINSYVICEYEPDLVVCNYSLPNIIADFNTFRLSNIPTQQEWLYLRDMVMRMPLRY